MLEQSLIVAFLVSAVFVADASAEDDTAGLAFNNHCRTCHSIKKGDNRLGPSMYGIYGAQAGRVEGYRGYSGGLTGLVWDEATLDRFIANPAAISSGTNMITPPVSDPTERKKIIQFLKSISGR